MRKMLSFGEVVGTLVKQGVLNRDLVVDLWWVAGLWARVQPAAERSGSGLVNKAVRELRSPRRQRQHVIFLPAAAPFALGGPLEKIGLPPRSSSAVASR